MLRLRKLEHLYSALQTTPDVVARVLDHHKDFVEEYLLVDPRSGKRDREVINIVGPLRALQWRLYRRVLIKKLQPSPYSHGGVVKRSIITNANAHIGSTYALTMDISDFFKSIHFTRIYKLFADEFECSPDVARVCTRLCTNKHHLAQGLITSPILADRLLMRADHRIGSMCKQLRLVYSRYVDDITISSQFPLNESCSVIPLVSRILLQDGFQVKSEKTHTGRFDDPEPITITGVRVKDGHLDVKAEYYAQVIEQLENAARLANGEKIVGPYYTSGQILGRVRFICLVNPGRRRQLAKYFRSINWNLVRKNAELQGLAITKKSMQRIDTSR